MVSGRVRFFFYLRSKVGTSVEVVVMALVFGRLDLRRGGDESLGETRTSSLTFTSPRPASVPRKNSTRSSLPALGGAAVEGERGTRVSGI